MSDQATPQSVLHLARVTLEAVSPVSLGSGDASSLADVLLFRDANGLPAIPGASLQGALRHLWAELHGSNDRRERLLFGAEDRNGEGQAGRLNFGFGAVHGADNVAAIGLLPPSKLHRADDAEPDPVLAFLADDVPVLRHHVKLDERHVADGRAKFDRAAVPIGTRFSFEIAMWGEADKAEPDQKQLIDVLQLLKHPGFRLGGAGRRGYGVVTVKRASYACPDIGNPNNLRKLREQPPSTPLHERLDLSPDVSRAAVATLKLRPLGAWRIGTTYPGQENEAERIHKPPPFPTLTSDTIGIRFADQPVGAYSVAGQGPADVSDKAADILVLREPRVIWRERNGAEAGEVAIPGSSGLPARFVVPGSALRGPLVHRMLFHWNKAQDRLVDADAADPEAALNLAKKPPEAFADLLGVAKERHSGTGRASRLFIADGIGTGVKAAQALTHNVIDRFAGGVINKLLYSEEVIVGGEITIELTMLPPPDRKKKEWDQSLVEALCAALHDLCSGRLAVGAKSHGFCEGTVEWSGAVEIWERQWRTLAPPPQPALQPQRTAGGRR